MLVSVVGSSKPYHLGFYWSSLLSSARVKLRGIGQWRSAARALLPALETSLLGSVVDVTGEILGLSDAHMANIVGITFVAITAEGWRVRLADLERLVPIGVSSSASGCTATDFLAAHPPYLSDRHVVVIIVISLWHPGGHGAFVQGVAGSNLHRRPVAFIAVAAWAALGVHTSIDRLEDFPVVIFMGGVIRGWSGFNTHASEGHERHDGVVGQK